LSTKAAIKTYNLQIINQLSAKAAGEGANVIAFHECSMTGYSFALDFSYEEMLNLAEFIPDGPSIQKLTEIAAEHNIAVLAGLFEKDGEGKIYKAYVCVDKNGLIAKFRKLHPFINEHITPGNEYLVFDLFGWKCGILICYDNNVVEND